MAQEGVLHITRPFRAWSAWSVEVGGSISMDSPVANRIFEWFTANSPQGSQNLEPIFTGAYYFDGCFWPVTVPLFLGTVTLEARSSLPTMPESIKNRLFLDQNTLEDFKALWADCLDYGMGYHEIHMRNAGVDAFWLSLLRSANFKIDSLVKDLFERRPGPTVMEDSRMVLEMSLKAILSKNHGLTEKEAASNQFGHNLPKVLDCLMSVDPMPGWVEVKDRIQLFAPIGERYAGKTYPPKDLWGVYKVAQFAASATVRKFSSYDARSGFATRF